MTTSSPDLSSQISSYESLFTRLQTGHTLVTGNSRLSRILSVQYKQWRIRQGDRQWQTPDILSWNFWLDRLWDSASLEAVDGTQRAVPGRQQLINLWESVLRDDMLASNLLRPESLASQLRDTRRLVIEWQLDLKDPSWLGGDNENYSAFHHWNQAFEKRCHSEGWIPPEDRTALLCSAIRTSGFCVDGTIDLLGFDEFNPGQDDFLKALIENGNSVKRLVIAPQSKSAVLWQSGDAKNELQQMARWVRYWRETEPGATIAVVVPDLQARRQEVERSLEEILIPGTGTAGPQLKPWNTSMGMPLARVPLVETAFDLLNLLDNRVDIQDIGRVLRSPWFRGGISERNSRALLEKCLRDKYPRQIKLTEVSYRAGEINRYDHKHKELPEIEHKPRAWNSPEMKSVLLALIQFEKNNKGARPASAWAEAIDQLLAGLGWPLAADSEKQGTGTQVHVPDRDRSWQALQAWRVALRELASLDATQAGLTRKAAINQLKQICRETVFQASTPPSSIQVLGLYEVSGLRFDHLWVLGLSNDNWPPAARPNPFIPGKLQRDVDLPNSSPRRELDVARTITRRLLDTAPDCVFSFPGQLDGEEVLPSPLLLNMNLKITEAVPAWQGDSWRTTVAKADKPKLQPLLMPGRLKSKTARGGSSILKNQALCPFRAFASNRLGAEGLETPADGISPMLHGSLVHSVLEYFWQETKTQAALLALDKATLSARVREHVRIAIDEERGLKQRPAFSQVESDRLFRRVMDYLDLEKTRESFEVTAFEKEILPEIEGQPIRLIIDRIDTLPSGEELIIDYKTGKVEPKKWFGDRPEDPQLPLYAISAKEAPAGVVFAIVRDDGCLYKGVVTRGGLLPGLPPRENDSTRELVDSGREMSKTIENWRQILHHLMADFLAGKAAVDPKNGRKTCANSYCDLHSLCRIGELEQIQKASRKQSNPEASL